ncbi:carotenoid biosynthesis protein [Panacibacter sp. DH6]|uniref:Carotenoid biosynthesis protein n=1 Tax=Panacibacter microcysteis TaxID=2793269 RepID=A0A931E220_9BACT|nr:carotenoid biosynthesis protein [Panacibacter microcysteis]MBG9375648.1 carotenoid biosynthesis protein [Panacibacter microcysteis]
MTLANNNKQRIALFLALLFHISGAIGMLFTPYRQWFIDNTPLNLVLMAALLVYTQDGKNTSFWLFAVLCFITGITVEIIGVNTGYLFGDYAYGNVMGMKVYNVPLLIGITWFTTIFCAGIIMHSISIWVMQKMAGAPQPSKAVQFFSFVTDAALLATLFDWVMEPVAIELQFWQWVPAGEIPLFNYICWLAISAGLLTVFRLMKFRKDNLFAVHLLIIQLLFFLVLQTFL